MVDITKCNNENCILKKKCYRYTSQSGIYQSWSTFEPKDDKNCDYFIDNKEK